MDLHNGWRSLTSRELWRARGASLLTKTKATKAVWFPPKAGDAASESASTAKKAAKKAAKRTTQMTTKKATGAAKRTSAAKRGSTKKVSSAVASKKS